MLKGFRAFALNSAKIITTAGLGKGSGILAGGGQELKEGVQVIVIIACDHNIISASTALCSTVTQRQSLPLIRGLCVCVQQQNLLGCYQEVRLRPCVMQISVFMGPRPLAAS